MNFWEKVKQSLRSFMMGRHGADQLGMFTLIAGLVLSLLASFTNIGLFSLLGLALYVWTLFRMFSRNTAKRAAENQAFMQWFSKVSTKVRQFIQRQKNRREYKYFRCAHCRALIRLKRGQGKVHGKCPRCQTEYDQNT